MINELKATLKRENNYQMTENGAVGYKSTGKVLTDLNFRVSSMRNRVTTDDMNLFIKAMDEKCDPYPLLEEMAQENPVGRNGTPEDVAKAMVYLADADFVTGQVLPVNGGFVL